MAKVDPSGRFEVDVHLCLTTALRRRPAGVSAVGRRAGFGASDHGVDRAIRPRGPYADRFARRDFQFSPMPRRRMQLWDEFQAGGSHRSDSGCSSTPSRTAYAHEGSGPRIGTPASPGTGPTKTLRQAPATKAERDGAGQLRTARCSPHRAAGRPYSHGRCHGRRLSPFRGAGSIEPRDVDEKRRILDEMLQTLDSARD